MTAAAAKPETAGADDELELGAGTDDVNAEAALAALDDATKLDPPAGDAPATPGRPGRPKGVRDRTPRKRKNRPARAAGAVETATEQQAATNRIDRTRAELSDELEAKKLELEQMAARIQALEDANAKTAIDAATTFCSILITGIDRALVKWRGPLWQLTPEELKQLGEAYGVAVAPYLGLLGTPWGIAIGSTIAVAMPRLAEEWGMVDPAPAGAAP